MDEQVAELENALERLEAEGARGYDLPACDCVRSLLTRAESLHGGARARLLERAQHHLSRLESRFARDRERAERRLEGLRSLGVRTEGALSRSLQRGELSRIHRTARRVQVSAPRHQLAVSDPNMEAPVDPRVRWRRSALAYEGSMAELVASFALARSGDVVPEDAGPYNARLIAHRALDTMRQVSPLYLRTQLERLDDLANLLQLPPLEPPPQDTARKGSRKPAAKRKGTKRAKR